MKNPNNALSNSDKNDLIDLLINDVKQNVIDKDYGQLIENIKIALGIMRSMYNYSVAIKNYLIVGVEILESTNIVDKTSKIDETKEDIEKLESGCKTQLIFLNQLMSELKSMDPVYLNDLVHFSENQNIIEQIEELESKFTRIMVMSVNNSWRYSQNSKNITERSLEHPFTDIKTHDLFNYIVDNWNYPASLKFGYILNFLNSTEKYLPHSKFNLKEKYGFKMGIKYRNEYIDFLGKEHDFYKDLQPEKAVSEKRYNKLIELYKTFCDIYV